MSKILYAASNMQHINNFHIPYIEKLKAEGNTVKVMASGDGADVDIPFVKKMLSAKNFFVRRKIKKILDGVPLSEPSVMSWIEQYLNEQYNELLKG